MAHLKRLLGNSSYTMKANLWGQGVGMATMLITPNLLSIEDYAKVVYVSFLLSFSTIYDIGLSAVYNRLAPSMVDNQPERLEIIESTLLRWLIFMGVAFSFVVSSIYFLKYKGFFESLAILIFLPLSLIVGFFLTREIVRERFDLYYVNSKIQSILKLLQLPFVYFFSILGWFLSSIVVNLIMFSKLFAIGILKNKYDILFIKNNLKEGLELSIKTLLWVQVLNFPRTFASLNYTDTQIANYGLVNSMYQVVVSISIAMFVPITIKTFKLFAKSDRLAFYFIKKVLIKTIPLFLVTSIVLMAIVPSIIDLLYQKYIIEDSMVWGYFATVMLFPFFFIIGIVFTGKQMNMQNIIISILGMFSIYVSCNVFFNLDYALFLLVGFISITSYFYILKGKK